MVESAQAKVRDHHCFSRWPLFYLSVKRSVFGEAVGNPILLKVRNRVADQAPQMFFVDRNHMVRHFATATAHPAFSDAVLPRRLNTCPFGRQPCGLQQPDDLVTEDGIVIKDHVTMRTGFGEGLAQLLNHPRRSRMKRHVVMQNPAPCMVDDEEAGKQLAGHRRNSKEIEGGDGLAVILQEGQPAPGRVTATAGASQITSDSPLVDDKTKLRQLAVNSGSTPTTVDFRNPWTFGKVSSDPRTASIGGQPLMNLTLAIFS